MELKILDLKDRFMRFKVTDITPAIANSIRRTLIADIPKLAIEKVVIHHGIIRDREDNQYDSSMPLFDEVVAQRIAMVPIKTDLKMNFREECTCGGKGCALCTATYSINRVGPCMVYSSDILPVSNPNAVIADPDIPIVKLGPKQGILISAEAIMGRGSVHSKWQVTSGVSHKYHREFIVNKQKISNWADFKKSYQNSIVRENEKEIVFTDDFGTRGVSQSCQVPGVEVREDSTNFIFKFETDGSLAPLEVLEYALNRLPQRLNIALDSLVAPD
ncbi:MAG: DNA-directed RNA polymerase subunit D [Candidatus Thermoplasmatota archaeon]|nr:DNA-directed RNA polymerase subunit D [Candidatus Thermoplasmatota archaeon]